MQTLRSSRPADAGEGAGDMLDALRAALAASDARALDAPRALAAHAMLEPKACLRFIVTHQSQVRALASPAQLARAIDVALEALAGEADDDAFARDLEAVAQSYSDLLGAASLAALLVRFPNELPAEVLRALEAGLARTPQDPALLRAALNVSERGADRARTDRLLTALGLADNTPATVASILRKREPGATPAPAVRIALLSSYTIDGLVPFLDLECRALGLAPEIYVAPFNAWTQEVLDQASGLRRFRPEIAFLALSIDDLVPQLAEALDGAALSEFGNAALERIRAAVEGYSRWAAPAPLVVHGLHSAFEAGPLGVAEGREGPTRQEWLAGLNLQLAQMLRATPGAYLLDVREALARSDSSIKDNPKLRHIAAMRLPPPALGAVANAYARYIAPLKGLTAKCVVLDLDNTLWGGVVGEDGPDGIRLGHTSPGSEFVEFQHFLAGLSRRGILLALNSKNNPEEALGAVRTHESMVLREGAFSAIRINWQPKPENMASIARELNIGLDAMVFVDDNPNERELMRQALPQVLTVDLPKDPAQYRSVLERLPQLQVLTLTDEDKLRAGLYETARRREETKLGGASLADYLHSLQIEASIARASQPVLGRIVQLFARTNQFNVTTRRYDAAEVERFAADPAWRLYVLNARDRFGDHGLVALGLVRVEPEVWTIDSFLMSCRVIGLGIETALLSLVSERAREAGAQRLLGRFIPSAKNAPALGIYADHGFVARESVAGVELWERGLSGGAIPAPQWIARTCADES